MDLDLRELLTGKITRLSHIHRWAISRGIRKESVADHSYYVTLYCLMIYRWWVAHGELRFSSKDSINLGDLLSRAVLHDIEECQLGDIPYPVKHRSKKLHKLLCDESEEIVQDTINSWVGGYDLAEPTLEVWRKAKDLSPAGKIVEFADTLSRLAYIAQEVQSNPSFLNDVIGFPEETKRFEETKYNFIRPLVSQFFDIVDEVFSQGGQKQALRDDSNSVPDTERWTNVFRGDGSLADTSRKPAP